MVLGGSFKITPILKKATPWLESIIPRLPGGSQSIATPPLMPTSPGSDISVGMGGSTKMVIVLGTVAALGFLVLSKKRA